MQFVTGLRCLRCGQVYDPAPGFYVCGCRPNVGSDLGTLDVEYDYAAIAGAWSPERMLRSTTRSIARFAPFLPIESTSSLPDLPVGDTPLLSAPRLASWLGLQQVYVKDDGRNPTGSLKDRASAIAVARAQEEGASVAATASTGNAAAALSGLCASVGLRNVIFVPETAPRAKLAQLLVYGSHVLAIRGSYDEAFDLCSKTCSALGWYNRNTGYNPYMSEGKKTVAYEIAAQVHEAESGQPTGFQAPDVVLVSVGDGCIIGGVYKGFYDLLQLGWIEHMPRIYGVQSDRSAALAQAWEAGASVPDPVAATTRADSINVNAPRDAVKALRAVRNSQGEYIVVSDEEIFESIPPLAQKSAIFAEPAGAAALAGLRKAVADGRIDTNEKVVIINTGSGLKDVQAAIDVAGGVQSIDATMAAVEARIASLIDARELN